MATRKEKHARALAKREEFLAEERRIGEKAIEVARKKREIEMRKAAEKAHDKHYKFDSDCSLCDQVKAKQALEKLASASKKPSSKAEEGINLNRTESPAVKDTTVVEEEMVNA